MRLFVAVNLADDVRSHIWRATQRLRELDLPVRWVRSDSLHITLKFLGDVDGDRVGAIADRLRETAAEARQHSLSIEGLGAFPSIRKPQTIWAGCDPAPALELTQHGIETRLADIGFPVEGRAFRPHVTVGRVKRGTLQSALGSFTNALEPVELATVALVSSVELMESQLGPSGPRYHVVNSFGLGA